MDVKNILILISAIVNFALGIFVLAKDKKKIVNQSYFLMTLGVLLWSLFMMLYRSAGTVEDSVMWCRILYAAPCLIVCSFVCFTSAFPENKINSFKRLLVVAMSGAVAYLSIFTDTIVRDVIFHPGEEKQIVFGHVYFYLYPFFISGLFIWGYIILIKKILKTQGILKNQLRYIFWGTFLASSLSMITNLTLPTLGIFYFNWFGQISTLLMVAFIAYAITRYRLMGAKLIFSNVFIYLFSSIFLVIASYIAVWIDERFFGSIFTWKALLLSFPLSFIVVSLFFRFTDKIQNLSDTLFYHGLNPKHVINKMVIRAARILDLSKLSDYLIQEIKKIIDADHVAVVLFSPDSEIAKKIQDIQKATHEEESNSARLADRVLGEIGNVSSEAFGELGHTSEYGLAKGKEGVYTHTSENKNQAVADGIQATSKIVQACDPQAFKIFNQADFPLLDCSEHLLLFNFLRLNKIETSIEDLTAGRSGGRHAEELLKIFTATGISLAVPLLSRERVIGAILLSEKYGNGAYSEEDIDFLRLVGAQIASSFMNAYLNDQVEVLNQNLEERVKAQTEDIIEKNKHLEKLLAMRSEFLNVASHQLRTPISVIKGMMSMFHEGSVRPQDMQLFVEGTFVKSLKLADIIDDVLKANEIESEGEYTIALSPTAVEPVLEAVVKEKSFEAKDKKLTLELNLPKEKLPKVLSENEALERAVKTLVSNALIYTKAGGVKVSAVLEGDSVVIRVIDTGIGVPKEDVPKLFHKFSRAKNATHAYTDGSGLGLYIAKKIIDAHKDAEIYVEKSVLGEGTTFAIKLKAEG